MQATPTYVQERTLKLVVVVVVFGLCVGRRGCVTKPKAKRSVGVYSSAEAQGTCEPRPEEGPRVWMGLVCREG